MKNIIHNLYLPVLCYLISYSSVNGQKTYNDSIHIIKKNYIDITIGGDPNKESLLKQLSTIPPRKGSVRPKYHRTRTVLSISSKEIKQLISTLRSDGSWQDINYDDTKRSGWEPKIHAEQILKLTKYYYREQQKFQPSEKTRLTDAIHQTMNFWFTKDWCARTDGTTQ